MSEKKTFAKLGYSMLDTAEVITLLNRIIANYTIYFQKLRGFHWNIKGGDFFELHGKFEGMYTRAIKDIDKVAERVRLFGLYPDSTYKKYLENSTIKEEIKELTSFEMVRVVLQDIRVLLELLEESIDAADEINDSGTKYLLQSIIYELEKDHWMLTAWTKQIV